MKEVRPCLYCSSILESPKTFCGKYCVIGFANMIVRQNVHS